MQNISININNTCGCSGSTDPTAPDFSAILVPRMAYIVNAQNGLYLTDTDGKVTQEVSTSNSNQMWSFERLDSGAYDILNMSSSNALSLPSESMENDIPIVTRKDAGFTIMQWRIRTYVVFDGDDLADAIQTNKITLLRKFINIFSGKAIDNPNGSTQPETQMIQYTRSIFNPNQIFILQAIG